MREVQTHCMLTEISVMFYRQTTAVCIGGGSHGCLTAGQLRIGEARTSREQQMTDMVSYCNSTDQVAARFQGYLDLLMLILMLQGYFKPATPGRKQRQATGRGAVSGAGGGA